MPDTRETGGGWLRIRCTQRGSRSYSRASRPRNRIVGFYISQTPLIDPMNPIDDVRRYTDATKVPYVALPPAHLRGTGLRIGDFCLAINMINGRFSYAVYADAKRQPNLGESPMRLVDNLGLPSGRQGGATRGVMFLVFPNSGIGQGSIPLDEELQFIEKYLEQVRFSDRLQVRWSIASEVRDALARLSQL